MVFGGSWVWPKPSGALGTPGLLVVVFWGSWRAKEPIRATQSSHDAHFRSSPSTVTFEWIWMIRLHLQKAILLFRSGVISFVTDFEQIMNQKINQWGQLHFTRSVIILQSRRVHHSLPLLVFYSLAKNRATIHTSQGIALWDQECNVTSLPTNINLLSLNAWN